MTHFDWWDWSAIGLLWFAVLFLLGILHHYDKKWKSRLKQLGEWKMGAVDLIARFDRIRRELQHTAPGLGDWPSSEELH